MKIKEHLKKDYWLRRVTPDRNGFGRSISHTNYKTPTQDSNGHSYLRLTQENLMDEVTPTAHKIFSEYLSKRPVYRPTGKKDEQGKDIWEINGYDEVEQVALAMQWRMAMSKTSHFAADGFWTADESPNGGKKEQYDKLKSLFWKNGLIRGLKEYHNKTCHFGFDIDAGPILFELTPSGTAFFAGPATFFNDNKVRKNILTTAEIAGTTIKYKKERHYLLANVALVGEAIMLAMRTHYSDIRNK